MLVLGRKEGEGVVLRKDGEIVAVVRWRKKNGRASMLITAAPEYAIGRCDENGVPEEPPPQKKNP